jgi:hypothetical protein
MERLRAWGVEFFDIEVPANHDRFFAAPDPERAEGLHRLLRTSQPPDVIFAARGGFGSIRLLEFLDWDLLRRAGIPVIGIIENYSDAKCPYCNQELNPIRSGGGERLAKEMGIPFIGKVPMSKEIAVCLDNGEPFVEKHPEHEGTKTILKAVEMIEDLCMGA